MRIALAPTCLAACHSSADSAQKASGSATPSAHLSLAIEGYGVHLVPVPSLSATLLPNKTIVFGPHATGPKPAKILNVAVRAGTPPTKLEPHAEGSITVYSDGAAGTTTLATGIDLQRRPGRDPLRGGFVIHRAI